MLYIHIYKFIDHRNSADNRNMDINHHNINNTININSKTNIEHKKIPYNLNNDKVNETEQHYSHNTSNGC